MLQSASWAVSIVLSAGRGSNHSNHMKSVLQRANIFLFWGMTQLCVIGAGCARVVLTQYTAGQNYTFRSSHRSESDVMEMVVSVGIYKSQWNVHTFLHLLPSKHPFRPYSNTMQNKSIPPLRSFQPTASYFKKRGEGGYLVSQMLISICSFLPPAGLPEDSTVRTPAFTDAVRHHRQAKGNYGTWDMMCGQPPQVRISNESQYSCVPVQRLDPLKSLFLDLKTGPQGLSRFT